MSEINMWEIEDSHFEKGVKIICGVDEAGRGPLAGPVCAAAVILPPYVDIPGLNDSKKLSDKRRRELFPIIKEQAVAYGIGIATHEEIDEINILQATYLAMERAINALSVKPELALVDGNRARDFGVAVETVIKGDSRSASIAAASILAKVTRDDMMLALADTYPQYGFDIHKGYGTKAHYAALDMHGISPIHRMSFLKKYHGKK
jgi:ribonuclease HII